MERTLKRNCRRRCRRSAILACSAVLLNHLLFSSANTSSLPTAVEAAAAFVTTARRNKRHLATSSSRLHFENRNQFGWSRRNSNSTEEYSSGTKLSVGASFTSWDLTSWELYNDDSPNGNAGTDASADRKSSNNDDDYCQNAQSKPLATRSTSTIAAASNKDPPPAVPKYKIYCDMDGCLVNFEKGVRRLLKQKSSDLDKRQMWEGISRAPLWFETLEWQMDGKRLWKAIEHLKPDILTGVPGDVFSSRVEKFNWCKRELSIDDNDAHHVDMAADQNWEHQSVNGNLPREDKINIITCWSSNKHKECNRHGSILIDDRIDLKQDWEDAGGIFIHHVNTETTIRKLLDLGVISEDPLEKEDEVWYCGEGSWNFWD